MGSPFISHWIDTIANPHGCFRSLGEFDAGRDAYGNIKFTAGNNAAVFRVTHEGIPKMLKCFVREDEQRSDKYRIISEMNDSMLSKVSLLEKEAYLYDEFGNGSFHDILICEWIEGNTLDIEIRRAGREFGASRFRELAALFDVLAAKLLGREWSHGDLKPENIVVTPADNAVLIDYDAMFVPGSDQAQICETGTPGYQHPSRDQTHYGPFLDDYPIALISTGLHAMALDPALYGKYCKGDAFILDPEEIMAGTSAAYKEILDLFTVHGEYALYELTLKLKSPTPEITGIAKVLNRYLACHEKDAENTEPELYCDGGLWGYKSKTGIYLTGPIFEDACEFSEELGIAMLNGNIHVLDTSGRMVINCGRFDAVKPFGCGLAAICTEGKWGYMDANGRITVEPRFEQAGTMHEGLGAVKINGKTGFIDNSGNVVIKAQFDHACGFRNGKAEVSAGGETFYIDHLGARV